MPRSSAVSAKPEVVDEAESSARERLLQAAATLFEEKGYARTTLGEVAEVASVSRPTAYRYFDDKEAMLWALTEVSQQLIDGVITETATSDSHVAIDQLRTFIVDYVGIAINQRVIFRIVLRTAAELSVEHQEIFRDRQRRVLRFVENLLRSAVEQKACRAPASIGVLAEAILGAASSALDWYRPSGSLSVTEVADEIVELIVNGLSPR